MSTLEARARLLADARHSANGDLRKFTADPYIAHPAAVAELIRTVPHTDEMLAACWVHDLVEHGCASLDEIEQELGSEVRTLVEMLTPVSRPSDGPRDRRKQIDRTYLSQASPDAMTIKAADIIDNVGSVVQRDPKFARVYVPEKQLDLAVLVDAEPSMLEQARHVVADAIRQLQGLAGESAGPTSMAPRSLSMQGQA